MKKSLSYSGALLKAMNYCAYQERCIHDLKLKNREWNLPSDEFKKLLNELKENGFLNEERYAESFVRGKFTLKKWGKLKIRQALYSKNIPEEYIERKIGLISENSYRKLIKELLERKMEQLKDDPDKNTKALRYLYSKGFELEVVRELMK